MSKHECSVVLLVIFSLLFITFIIFWGKNYFYAHILIFFYFYGVAPRANLQPKLKSQIKF